VHISSRAVRRASVVAVLTTGVLALAVPSASAHVEVSAPEGIQAGTGPVTLTFMAEAESTTVGIVAVQSQLPAGIAPEDVTLAGGPAGWTLTPTPDGFEVSGPDIGAGVDAEFSVTVAQLPVDTTELSFPTLQRYADGREDAWIEPVTDALPDPDMPAPVLTVAPAPPGATAASTTPAAEAPATASSSASPSAQPEAASRSTEEESSTGTVALVLGIVVVLALGVAAWIWRSRRAR
jgi:ribosomal protein L12E/L44/L45/RPP1/RPP2